MRTGSGRRLFAATALALLCLLLQGCATPSQTASLARDPLVRQLVQRVELADTPFFSQEAYQCGPAALAMVLNAAGADLTPEQLAPEVYLPARQGSLQPELVASARRHGFVPYPLAPALGDLLREVEAGTPVLVLQNLGLSWYPVWHYAVVIGFDLTEQELILRSGPERRQRLSFATFERTWARGDRWALLAMLPDQLPTTANAERWLAAAVALEQTGAIETARRAYQTAHARWPDELTPLIGLGNMSAATGDLPQAAATFEEASRRHPESAIAFNNLADILAQLGHENEALAAARRAVALGGPYRDAFVETLRAIEARLAAAGGGEH